MKQNQRKWLIAGSIATVGVLAMIMGFAAAFGNAHDSIWAVDGMYKSLYTYATGVFKSHLGMAYIGGIIIGSIGVITTLSGSYALWLAYTNSLPTTRKTMYCVLAIVSVIMILAIAAVACQLQLNSTTWLGKNVNESKEIESIIAQVTKWMFV